jgi:hypothetical protein
VSSPIPGRATVLVATVNSGKWFQSGSNRFDFVLDVHPGDGSPGFRTELVNERIYQAKPKAGIDVAVEIAAGTQDVTLLWKGDPNLDLDAWRAQREQGDRSPRDAALRGDGPSGPSA